MNQAVLESKKNVVTEIADKMKNSGSAVVAEYRGLSVAEVTELRRALMAEHVEMKVYKNTLAARAAEAAGYGDLKNVLTGPNAIAFGKDETAAARVMAQFAKKHKALILKGGIVEGRVIGSETVAELSQLRTEKECCQCCYLYYRHLFPALQELSMLLLKLEAVAQKHQKKKLQRQLPKEEGGKNPWQS